MILGFAHLTRSTATPDAVIAELERDGRTVKARRKDVPSAQEKLSLLQGHARTHELALLTGQPPIEVVSHDTGAVAANSRLDFDATHSEILVKARDGAAIDRFFTEGLGFRAEQGMLRLDGRFPQWSVGIRVAADRNRVEGRSKDPAISGTRQRRAVYARHSYARACRVQQSARRDRIASDLSSSLTEVHV